MANVINIEKKRQRSKAKKAELIKQRKLLAVQKVFQCTHCAFKCEKCGTQINPEERRQESENGRVKVPYRFCDSCSAEYIDYIERLNGRGDPDCYWHNEFWLESWRRWIDYQGVIDSYLKSKEFVRLLQELKETRSDI